MVLIVTITEVELVCEHIVTFFRSGKSTFCTLHEVPKILTSLDVKTVRPCAFQAEVSRKLSTVG